MERTFKVEVKVQHGLLYDVIDTDNQRVSGIDHLELLSARRGQSLCAIDDWRKEVTPALGIVSPRTGETLWIPRPCWFTPTFSHTVFPTLRPDPSEWREGSFTRELTSKQLHQALRTVKQYQAGKWHEEYCSHDDCPLGCGAPEFED